VGDLLSPPIELIKRNSAVELASSAGDFLFVVVDFPWRYGYTKQ